MTDTGTAPKPRLRLTALSHGAGCACKLGSVDLAEVLRHLPTVVDPRVLVDAATRDDAAIFRLSDDRALVATMDFFTPIVDDPRAWGAIAAANALSDVYAMGGTPLFALNLVGWPREKVPFEVLGEVLAGAVEVTERARCPMLGGHSIDVAGAAVRAGGDRRGPPRPRAHQRAAPAPATCWCSPSRSAPASCPRRSSATRCSRPGMAEAVRSMTTLNEGAARAALAVGVSAATDVTGFGLLGHLGNMLAASKVGAEIAFEALPILPHALSLAGRGIVPGGTQRNLRGRRAGGMGGRPDADRADHLRRRADLRRSAARRAAGERGGAARGAARGGDAGGRGHRAAHQRSGRAHPGDPSELER